WIEYLIKEDTVSLYRDARVSYGEMTLTADRVRFFSGRDLLVADGYCELTDPAQTMMGVRMSYDLETGKGVILRGDADSAEGYYRGRRIKKIEEKTLAAQRGSFTTCDLGQPHYRFWSPKLKVYVEDKVVARPAVLFMGEVPVAAAPFYFFSLREDRHSGLLPPYIRYSKQDKLTVNSGFYWVINDFSDATFLLDYNAFDGWRKGANLVYLYGSRSTVNNFYASHMRERDEAVEWWKIYSSHRQDFTDDAAALLRLDLRNSTDYDDEFDEDFEIRTEQRLESFANVSQNWTDYQLSLDARFTKEKTEEADEGSPQPGTLFAEPPHEAEPYGGTIQRTRDPFPRVNFYATRKELAETRFYYQYNAGWVNYYDFEEAGSVLKEGAADVSASRPLTLFRYLRLDPGAAGHGYWFDRDKFGRNHRFLGTWDTTASASTKVYGIFESGDTVFRHIVNPTVTHNYRPDIDQSWMVTGGAVYPEQSRLSLALRQSFDVKFPEEEEAEEEAEAAAKGRARSWEDVYRPERTGARRPRGESIPRLRKATALGKVVNLATWDTTTTYNLGPLSSPGERPFSDLVNTIEVTPNFRDWYFLSHRLQLTNDTYDFSLLDLDATTTISFTTGPLAREEGELDESWREAADPYGRPRVPEDEDLDPNVYSIDTITGRRYEAGEGMGQGWNFSFTHDYSWSEGGFDLHTLKGAVSFDVTKKWRLGYDAYYDVAEGEVISEHYRVYRNLHRWEAEVRISLEREEVIYWFQVRLIDIPEIELYSRQERTF
ncbi:MAG: putative LPS assembly protein LptD, partial [bacterium]